MRAALDTNVLVSSLITPTGRTAELLERLIYKKVEIVVSKPILDEFVRVVHRPKFRRYVGEKQITDFLQALLGYASLIEVKSKFNVTNDKVDNALLATAHDAKADHIVSGDKLLRDLKRFRGIKIVTVTEMLRLVGRVP